MFAVIETGGKQYLVEAGQKIRIEKLEGKEGDAVMFDSVLLISDSGKTEIGMPLVDGAKVSGTIAKQGRDKKKIVFRYKAKVRRRKMKGHRQPFTDVEILNIKK